jgi:Hyphally regulated cell wall protein N-terminal
VSTTVALINDGVVALDASADEGGSSLTVARALTNSQELGIGNATLSASDEVTAASIDNTGFIQLTGSSANQALLDVSGSAGFGAPHVLSGHVRLTGDSAIEFASGQITKIDAGSKLTLDGKDAFIEDKTALGSNSALTGLTNVAGSLYLVGGASLSTNGALTNNGSLGMDLDFHSGGSALSVAGGLTNNGALYIGLGAGGLSEPDTLTAETLSNTNTGMISLYGNGKNQALLDVTTGAGFGTAGTVTGTVALTEDSAIEFLSGQIGTIGAGSDLVLSGDNAFIEDSTALGSNSALTGLTDIAGSLYLVDGASMSTTGAVTNSGFLDVDFFPGDGGSHLSIAGRLTNSGTLDIGDISLFSSDSATAKSFLNSGTVYLNGYIGNLAALNVAGATTNNGSISIAGDTETLAGPVGGTGSIHLTSSRLLFDSSVSAGQTIDEKSKDKITLEQAQSFAATISGFGTGDTIDATNFLETATTYNFVENLAGTGGTLTLRDGSLTAKIHLTGDYSKSNFALAPDSGTGTLVKFV